MRDHKLIMGSTQHFSSHLKSIIMQNTSVPRCGELNTNGEQANKWQTQRGRGRGFPFHFFSLASPEPDDSMRDDDGRVDRSKAFVQVRSMMMREQNMEKSLSYE